MLTSWRSSDMACSRSCSRTRNQPSGCATLLGTEEVARPANFKVSHGNPEASTKHGISLQGAKTLQSGWVLGTCSGSIK